MRLLHTSTLELEEFNRGDVPPYAILSHTWGKKEVTLQDMQGGRASENIGYVKVQGACSVAAADGFKYIWIDTCCIDNRNNVELSEAINSMYFWYKEAKVCFAYLADVPSNEDPQIADSRFFKSRWFTRGWTLQEWLAAMPLLA